MKSLLTSFERLKVCDRPSCQGAIKDSLDRLEHDQCQKCYRRLNADFLKEIKKTSNGHSLPLVCIHKGEATGEVVLCSTCNGAIAPRLKLFHCDIHGKCTEARKVEGFGCCKGCEQKEFKKLLTITNPVRHLLYHILPISGNGVWQRNVGQILRRIKLFNGHRVVAICTGPRLDPPDHVKDQFAGHVHEFIEVPNNPGLREVATFERLFERVENTNDQHFTFYCQAKGVTRPLNHPAHPWTDLLYQTNLDFWPLVQDQLRYFPTTGTFKKVGRGWRTEESQSEWHYSGSFFWFRNRDLFSKSDWKRIDRFWSGIEPYPSLHFKTHEAGCLFHEGRVPTLNLYSMQYLMGVVMPDFERWKEENKDKRTIF